MLSKTLTEALNEQIKFEFLSSHLYLAAAAYCYTQDMDGFANFFIVQAEEEKFHAMKFFHFVNEMDADVDVRNFEIEDVKYESLTHLFEYTLEHEKLVTKRIYDLMELATKENEYATISFLKWFVDEQVEEMASFKTFLQKIKRAENNPAMLFQLDEQMAQRQFVPPTA